MADNNIENFEIFLIRLKNGEDIIGFVYQFDDIIRIKYPKTFYVNYDTEIGIEELILIDWIPKLAYSVQEVQFKNENILFVAYATIEFGIKYLTELVDTLDSSLAVVKELKSTLKLYQEETKKNVVEDKVLLH